MAVLLNAFRSLPISSRAPPTSKLLQGYASSGSIISFSSSMPSHQCECSDAVVSKEGTTLCKVLGVVRQHLGPVLVSQLGN
eukprot:5777273-Amphidinium_carterae.1